VPELDALLAALEDEERWGGTELDMAHRTLALGWIHHPLRPDAAKALSFARQVEKQSQGRDPEKTAILAEVQALSGDLRGAVLTLEDALHVTGDVALLRRLLAEDRRALGKDLPSFRSIDDALDALDIETVIPAGASWRYFPGTREPSEGLRWTEIEFPDGEWAEGPSGFGYGKKGETTLLEGMQGKYLSLYVRKRFSISQPETLQGLALSVRFDDGFIAYLNGREIGRQRAGKPGERVAWNTPADDYVGEPVERVLSIAPGLFLSGENCLALQGLNSSLISSSDFLLLPALSARRRSDPAKDRALLDGFRAAARGEGAEARAAYLEARTLQRAGRGEEASRIFRDLSARDPGRPEPTLQLVEILRSLGKAGAAEEMLRAGIRGALGEFRDVWDLWSRVARDDLGRTPAEVLGSVPLDAPGSWWTFGDARRDPALADFVLTEAEVRRSGRAFLKVPLPMGEWTAEFELRVENPGGYGGGAEGLTLAFLKDFAYPPSIGGSMDLNGDGYAVEFDTYPLAIMGDPPDPHIAVMRKTTDNPSFPSQVHLAIAGFPGGFSRDAWHPVRVVMRGGTISVSFDGREVISGFAIPGFQDFVGYIGFTAATGGGYQVHRVRSVRFQFPAGTGSR
jgi:hypothetical protein